MPVTGLLGRFSDHTRRVFARHRSRQFLEGAMAASALVALSDGDASMEEGAEVGRLMRVLDMLQDHDPEQGVESYLMYIDSLRRAEGGIERAREAVKQAAEAGEEAAALLLVICNAISEADGIVRESEIEEIRVLSNLIGMEPQTAANLIAPLNAVESQME